MSNSTPTKHHDNCTPKEDMFARLFAGTGDATQSHIYAYKESPKRNTNRKNAYLLLQKERVQDAVDYYRSILSSKIDIKENRILAEMGAIALSNVVELFNDDTTLKDLTTLDMKTQRVIKSIKVNETILDGEKEGIVKTIQIEMHPKLLALKFLAELKGMEGVTSKKKAVNVTVNIQGESNGYRSEKAKTNYQSH